MQAVNNIITSMYKDYIYNKTINYIYNTNQYYDVSNRKFINFFNKTEIDKIFKNKNYRLFRGNTNNIPTKIYLLYINQMLDKLFCYVIEHEIEKDLYILYELNMYNGYLDNNLICIDNSSNIEKTHYFETYDEVDISVLYNKLERFTYEY